MFAFDTPIVTGTDTFDTQRDGAALDLLGRKAFGQRLSDLMGRGDQPLVVALDGGWGAGKSHFLKLWTGSHEGFGGKARVVYFDAFERDYLDDPLISLVAAITRAQDEREGRTTEKAVRKLKSVAVKLAKPAIRIGLAAATAGVSEGEVSVWDEVFDKSLEAMSDEAKAALDKLWQREEGRIAAVEGFRSALEDLAVDQPLVLVIDELDRCRPDYALSLLEVVKHFFAVKGVRFLLGVNLEALEHSVRQRYGAGGDAGLYLQKFVHLKIPMPAHDENSKSQLWAGHFHRICASFGIPDQTYTKAETLLELAMKHRTITLRDVERLASRIFLLPSEFNGEDWPIVAYVLTACTLEVIAPDIYRRLRRSELVPGEVSKLLSLDQRSAHDGFSQEVYALWQTLDTSARGGEAAATTIHTIKHAHIRRRDLDKALRDYLDTFAPPPAR